MAFPRSPPGWVAWRATGLLGLVLTGALTVTAAEPIDRHALVTRHNPKNPRTAARLGERELAVDLPLRDGLHNRYLANGHCPQPGADLAVYLPANGALLAAVAMMAEGWDDAPPGAAPGFPDDGGWTVRAEGLRPLP